MGVQQPYKEFIDSTDFPQVRLIQVNNCGSERVVKHDYTILRSKGRHDFHFLYLQSGWLDAEIGNTPVRLQSGQCAVFLPGIRQMYTFSAEGNPISFFIHFTGLAAAECMSYLTPLEPMMYTISERTSFEALFRRIIRVHNIKTSSNLLEENQLLLQLIAAVSRSGGSAEIPVRNDILYAMEYIQTHLQEEIDLKKYAQSIHISGSRFAHLFTQTAGIAPHQYLLRMRLERARGLLRDSSMNISEITETVGFSDPFYFSRLFRKAYGISPKSFREECRTKE